MKKISRINDFVIRFANVNGSGSASANNLFAKVVYRLGVPVSPKNVFPSNIQGLPTWYEVRVNQRGYLGRRGGADFVVAVNGQTMEEDYRMVEPGGYFLYDSTRPLPDSFRRDDLTIIDIPLTRLCNEAFSDNRVRQLMKNIIYIGALAHLLDIGLEPVVEAVQRQFAKKPKLAEPNVTAIEIGFQYAREHHRNSCALSIRPSAVVGDRVLLDGNSATALGALYAGATVAGWYPITPSTSVIEAFERFAGRYRIDPDTGQRRYAVVQAEDELAAIGIAIGGGWNGARSFTATSGPGISLMAEFLGLAYFAEIPVVLIDVQRSGPSTGMPTRTQQSDLLACAYASHGDTRNVLLVPADPNECFTMTADAFDLADRLQTPVIVMSDLDLGMNDHLSAPLSWPDERRYDRGKVLGADELDRLEKKWGRYLDIDRDGICYRTLPGTHPEKGAYVTRGTSHTEYAAYTEESAAYERGMKRLLNKWETARCLVPLPECTIRNDRGDCAVIYYGSTTAAALEALDRLKESDIILNSMRIKAFPFQKEVFEFIDRHDTVFIIEQNRDAQMRILLAGECQLAPGKLKPVINFNGLPITARMITNQIHSALLGTRQAIPASNRAAAPEGLS
ncbi:2-oxoacid:acceptor oxidoreductase subunit alpha [Desulfofustis glycolicus]|uniref:2-oxoglutarate ferredoxin oxidoreductase subunit alpha n=1 Tax=Desulfofustis glycolicus DSM 9705 TaxID=1121409 RepID=A0A1M5WDW0_9BACT|nr:2-oxoacid:acceptor oxidoreductase subunit alpha [Desulfofustis glycolicus]MCB2217064.1 2-oxoacid:acceptor oxidoreductase subunit alpha [Desulfobulbaceae bacterium]SHH85578.1 2-oxoglutarate ferredoxin oxidoreductase subunit alpha [Desulfofustis glycolicus DSM 9705]